jgi:hypothetical protein
VPVKEKDMWEAIHLFLGGWIENLREPEISELLVHLSIDGLCDAGMSGKSR